MDVILDYDNLRCGPLLGTGYIPPSPTIKAEAFKGMGKKKMKEYARQPDWIRIRYMKAKLYGLSHTYCMTFALTAKYD